MDHDEYIKTIEAYAERNQYDSLRVILSNFELIKSQVKRSEGFTTLNSIVLNRFGIHARPSRIITTEARNYPETRKIYFKNYNSPERFDARSIIKLMTMEGYEGSRLLIEASGEDVEAEKIVMRMHGLIIAKDCDEMDPNFFEKQMILRKITG